MKYTIYNNFDVKTKDTPTPFNRYIVNLNSERQFNFTQPNTLTEKYIHKQMEIIQYHLALLLRQLIDVKDYIFSLMKY